MTLHLPSDLESVIQLQAAELGITPQSFVERKLREVLTPMESEKAPGSPTIEPRDDWERRLRAIARDCGVALSNEELSSEGLYD